METKISCKWFRGADENLHVIERSYDEDGQLIYDFTVTDETVWSARKGAYVWQEKNESKVCRVCLPRRALCHGEYFERRSFA